MSPLIDMTCIQPLVIMRRDCTIAADLQTPLLLLGGMETLPSGGFDSTHVGLRTVAHLTSKYIINLRSN